MYLNKPEAKSTEIPWRSPLDPANPVVRGLPLHYGAIAISNLSFVQQVLWNNAGFGSLRDRPELEGFEPRYEPNVVKTDGIASAANDEQHLGVLLDETWRTRKPASKVHSSVLDYHEAYKSGRLTPTAVAEAILPLIQRNVKKPHVHSTAFLQTREDIVLKAAEESTRRYRAGQFLSPLDGVPVACKDECDLAGYDKCFGSNIDFTRKDDATSYCMQRWLDAGAVIVGKTNMHEFGSDTTGNNPHYGTPLNPNNKNYYCGGSSSGSAYAVAAGLVPLCQGNDGGGSIRIPSTYVGIYGLKPSAGRVSKRPSPDLAKSNGVSGPMAANMIDLEIGYRIMAQPDALDHEAALFAAPGSTSSPNIESRNKVLGIYKPWFDRADPVVRSSCQTAIDHLTSKQGYTAVDITIPLLGEGQLAHAMTILSELVVGVKPSDTHILSAPNKVLLSVARKTTSVDFLQAQRLRNLIMQHLTHLYTLHPGLIIVTPTTPNAGWRIEPGDLTYGVTNSNKSIRNMEYVWLANFTGCPAISVPVGYAEPEEAVSGSGRIPIGFMGMGEWCTEDELIAFGYDCERFLSEAVEGGRCRPGNWTDVLELARESK